MSLFGLDLPPGCTLADIERAQGPEPPDHCLNPTCGCPLDEDNDPDCSGLCSPACVWPAIAHAAEQARLDALADAAWEKEHEEAMADIPDWWEP